MDFVIPHGRVCGVEFGFDVGEKPCAMPNLICGTHDLRIGPADAAIQHAARGAAAVVADAVEMHHFRCAGIALAGDVRRRWRC